MMRTIRNKRIKKLKPLFIVLIVVTNTSCGKSAHQNNLDTTNEITINNEIKDNRAVLNERQISLLKAINYFSIEYPYSINKLEDYFNIELYSADTEESDQIYLSDVNKNITNLENIYLRGDRESGQIMHLKYKEPVCFNADVFLKKMDREGYTLELIPPISAYSRIMDVGKGIGTLRISYKLVNKKEDICILGLSFNTFETFDSSRFL